MSSLARSAGSLRNPVRKFRPHRGLVKRVVVSRGGVRMGKVGVNKYAGKRSARNRALRKMRTRPVAPALRGAVRKLLGPLLRRSRL